jgi:hypothetical protein
MMVLKAGNVGIGTTSPDRFTISGGASVTDGTTLTIDSGSNTNQMPKLELAAYNVANGNDIGQIIFGHFGGDATADGYGVIAAERVSGGGDGDIALTFGTGSSGTERMRIDSSGNLLLGTTSNSRASKMKIDGSATTGDILQLTGGNSGYIALYISQTAATNHIYCDDTGSVQFYVTTGGNYYFSGASASDRDLKENINTIPNGSLDLIKLLTPRTFNFKAEENFSTKIKTGFIAQEVAEVITEGNVATGTDGQKDMAVDTTGIVAHLVKAIQEQQTLIEAQATTITDLTNRIETLENV